MFLNLGQNSDLRFQKICLNGKAVSEIRVFYSSFLFKEIIICFCSCIYWAVIVQSFITVA